VSEFLCCLVRGVKVVATPEERVRQALIARMVDELGYPRSLLAVEKAIHQLPHLSQTPSLPNRRTDLLCFSTGTGRSFLYPLLLVECKAALPLTEKVLQQVVGYNEYVQAPYIAIVNEQEIKTGWWDSSDAAYRFVNWLPRYEELKQGSREE
jgi:hypothetical protein